jgi:hypothetical protein
MKKLLLATAALFAMTVASQAAMFNILTPDPTSQQGNFSLAPGAGPFEDQVTFTITQASTFTIANATNTYASPQDQITGWNAAIWDAGLDQIVNNADDNLLFGPQAASACIITPNCQIVGGSGFLNGPGIFYAEFQGTGSGTSGYSGNISVAAAPVPGPIVGAGLPGLIVGALAFLGWRRRRQAAA